MTKKPNLVIFNPDQWRGDAMGHMGDPAAVTPYLDQSVKEDAVSFRNAFCQNTVCTPSRCSFMTGWYPHTNGHRTMRHMLQPHEPSLLHELRKAGYRIWWGGKNDLFPGQTDVSDYCDVYFHASEEDHARWGRPYNGTSTHGELDWRGDKDGDNWFSFYLGKLEPKDKNTYTDWDWQKVLGACDAIRNHDGDQPICLFITIGHPHPPYAVEEPYYSMIDRSKVPPRTPTPEDWSKLPKALKGIYDGQRMQGWSEERWNELRATYYGMCTRVDHQWGMLVEALKEKGLYDETAMFLFSDHGDFTGDYGLVEKVQNTFQDCLSRVPFVVKPPKETGVKPRVSEGLAELVDFPATVYDLCGIQPDYWEFGKSLVPLLQGGTDAHRDATFCEGGRLQGETHCMELANNPTKDPNGLYSPRQLLQYEDEEMYHGKAAMCRTKTHKYVRRFYETDELYDLVKDPRETTNLIDDPAYTEVLAQLQNRMLTWYMETCDTVPLEPDDRNFHG